MLTGKHFFVIDDDSFTLTLVERFLTDAGARVTTSDDSELAFRQIIRDPPDCVVTDLMMPKLDGYGLCAELRQHPALRMLVADEFCRIDDHTLADHAGAVLPQVRTDAWVRAQAPRFGDAALVTRSLSADLRVCYVIDLPAAIVFVTQAHMRAWRVDEAALYRAACANLRRRGGGELPMPEQGAAPVLMQLGDGYDAARLLLLDPSRAEGLLVAVPERDAFWMGKPDDADLARLMNVTRAQSEASPYPVSASLYRMSGGELVRVSESVAE
jgi:CheY-like chemotaxis protein